MNAERLLALYEKVAEALDTVPRLRRFVLDLAVRGKLVAQDAADEPASELLKQIAAEKARLVKVGEIRNKPDLPAVETSHQPNPIPSNWKWVRFGNIVDFSAGRTPSRNETSFWNTGDYPWVSIADMADGQVVESTKETVSEMARKAVFKSEPEPAGTMIMSFKLTIGKIARLGIPAFHNEAIISIRSHLADLGPYLFKVLPDLARGGDTKGAIKGATLNRESISNILIPLPPLAEQRRIVAKVQELMALLDRLEAARTAREATRDRLTAASLARLTAPYADPDDFPANARFALATLPAITTRPDQIRPLRQTILNLAVYGRLSSGRANLEAGKESAEPVLFEDVRAVKSASSVPSKQQTLPSGWCFEQLGNLIYSMKNGVYKPARHVTDDGVLCVRMYNIQGGSLGFEKVQRLELSDEEIEQFSLSRGDLLVNRVNSRELVGKAALVRDLPEDMVFEAMTIRVRFDTEKLLPQFANLFFMTSYVRSVFEGDAKQAVGQASISQPQIRGLLIPLPPLAEQRRIVAKVDALMALCDRLEAALTTADTTRARLLEALLHEALTPAENAMEAAE